MPLKSSFTTEIALKKVPVPTHGPRYTTITHGQIIDTAKNRLQLAGFNIKEEIYKTNLNGEVAQGIYHLDYSSDPEMGLSFAWSNSYDKTMRFKSAIGAHVFVCMNGVVSGDMRNYGRRHTGTALADAVAEISLQIQHATQRYEKLVKDKDHLKNVTLSQEDTGNIIGQLYLKESLTLSQIAMVKRELEKPSFTYNAPADSAWTLYNHITLSLKDSHPNRYLMDHKSVHEFFMNYTNQTPKLQQVAINFPETPEDVETLEKAVEEFEASLFGVNFS